MAENEEPRRLTLSEVEEVVNEFALRYAKEHTSLPVTAFRVFLWPGDFFVKITPGPTARIIMGILPNHPDFNDTMRRAIDRVWSQKLYSTMAVELVAHILERDASWRHWLKERYNFDPELIPHMIGDEELSVRHIERIEVVHTPTGLREVIEVEPGTKRTTFATRDIAKLRLARRVHELRLAEQRKLQEKDNALPFPQSA